MRRFVSLAALLGWGMAAFGASPQVVGESRKLICSISDEHFICKSTDDEVCRWINQLSAGCASARAEAARHLGRLELHCHPEIEPALASALVSDCDKKVRLMAVKALVRLGAALPCTAQAYRRALVDDCLLARAYAKAALKNTPGFGPCPGPGCVGTGYRAHSTRLKPFELGTTRYEPSLRDIRLLPASTTLPGGDSGIQETLPVLPPRSHGYFLLPTH